MNAKNCGGNVKKAKSKLTVGLPDVAKERTDAYRAQPTVFTSWRSIVARASKTTRLGKKIEQVRLDTSGQMFANSQAADNLSRRHQRATLFTSLPALLFVRYSHGRPHTSFARSLDNFLRHLRLCERAFALVNVIHSAFILQ